MFRIALYLFFALTVVSIVHAFYYYPRLPDVVASHFSISGQPDAWSSKGFFIGIYIIAVVMNALIFLGITFGINKIPDSMLNLPHKVYWLSEERRQGTFDFFNQYFLWLGIATCLLLLDIFHQTFNVHLGNASSLQHPWMSLGLYLLFSIGWCVGLFFKFFRMR
jgi:hypothetical protein